MEKKKQTKTPKKQHNTTQNKTTVSDFKGHQWSRDSELFRGVRNKVELYFSVEPAPTFNQDGKSIHIGHPIVNLGHFKIILLFSESVFYSSRRF